MTLEEIRDAFADDVVKVFGVNNARVRDAFATVPREAFLGPGPWLKLVDGDYVETASDDPTLIYTNHPVALIPSRHLNNGEPSYHANAFAAADPQPGEHVVHVGAGTGYYTAILAELVGSDGQVTAIEIDEGLAEVATANLGPWPQVTVECRSGTQGSLPECDIVYLNAGVSAPMPMWLDALRLGGRLILPLAPRWSWGGLLMATRAANGFHARFVSRSMIIPCVGGPSHQAEEQRLQEAYEHGGLETVRALHMGTDPTEDCWFAGDGRWLSTREIEAD